MDEQRVKRCLSVLKILIWPLRLRHAHVRKDTRLPAYSRSRAGKPGNEATLSLSGGSCEQRLRYVSTLSNAHDMQDELGVNYCSRLHLDGVFELEIRLNKWSDKCPSTFSLVSHFSMLVCHTRNYTINLRLITQQKLTCTMTLSCKINIAWRMT